MLPTLNLVKALPLALMLSTALANPVPEANSTAKAEKRIIGNDSTWLICVNGVWQCGFYATYTNGDTRQTVKWTTGNPTSSNPKVMQSNQDWCVISGYRKHTNDAGFWSNADIHWKGASHTIGYDPTGNSIDLGNPTSQSTDHDYLNGRCLNEFGGDFSNVAPEYGSGELFWSDIGSTLY
ncbi:hypothetical protein SEPCBS57363_002589 [Sporothrix epigloea]|uniref:Uncharacterized protein n=1 Tax=Sporothrix epigloea TaxID=1892477 RepID=A0ABP0DIH9_9PEZI